MQPMLNSNIARGFTVSLSVEPVKALNIIEYVFCTTRKEVRKMEIIESWEDQQANIYAIVRHSQEDQQAYRMKEYEAMWIIDNELYSFGGSVGNGIADFGAVEEAQDFLLKGISECEATEPLINK